jgi:hypothetical protein
MPATISNRMLTLSNTQAKKLAGNWLTFGGNTFRFKDYDPDYPGQPPWRSGAEGKAYPLIGPDNMVDAYMKFFTRPTSRRLSRTAWLIGQQMHTWLPNLAAAPLLWIDTRNTLRPPGLNFDFAGYLAQAVPGETWLELKNRITDGKATLCEEIRWRCVGDLLLATAVLEQAELIHGDLSPNNIVIDLAAPPRRPAAYFIDFDAFVSEALGADRQIVLIDGGTYGTEGYCPADLGKRASTGDGSVAPYSDRHARDMLLLELLLMDRGFSSDDPPSIWDQDRLHRCYGALRARGDPTRSRILKHLEPEKVFSLTELQRPASKELAAVLGLSLPPRPKLRPAASLVRSVVPSLSYLPTAFGNSLQQAAINQFKLTTGRSPGTGPKYPTVKPAPSQQASVGTGQALNPADAMIKVAVLSSQQAKHNAMRPDWKDVAWMTIISLIVLLIEYLLFFTQLLISPSTPY